MKGYLSKKEAQALITPVIDNEASTEEREAFFEYIEHDKEIKQIYLSEKAVKNFIKTRYKPVCAPDSLRNFVKNLSDYYGDVDIPDEDNFSNPLISQDGNLNSRSSHSRYYLAVAAILIFSFMLYLANVNSEIPSSFEDVYMETVTLEHFDQHFNLGFPDPEYTNISTSEAEILIKEHFGKKMTVPELHNAKFEGLFFSTFSGDYTAPLLKYNVNDQNDVIFVFAFQLENLVEYVHRDEEAIKACQKFEDYHIINIDNRDIVSWKWDNDWYTAVSFHDGEVIAGMLPHN